MIVKGTIKEDFIEQIFEKFEMQNYFKVIPAIWPNPSVVVVQKDLSKVIDYAIGGLEVDYLEDDGNLDFITEYDIELALKNYFQSVFLKTYKYIVFYRCDLPTKYLTTKEYLKLDFADDKEFIDKVMKATTPNDQKWYLIGSLTLQEVEIA